MGIVPPPNYTIVPNIIFELWPVMTEAERGVVMVITRETFGWHRPKAKLSLTDLQKATGLSRQGVINGVNAAMERGTIGREQEGRGYSYFMIVNEVDSSQETADANRSTELTKHSQPSRPKIVKPVDQPEHTLNKGKKKKERKTSDVPPVPRQRNVLFDAIVEVCRLNTNTPGGYVAKTKKGLLEMGKTADDVLAFGKWWYANDWRGQMNQPPTLHQLVTDIEKPNSPPPNGDHPDKSIGGSNPDIADFLRRRKEAQNAA